MVIMDWITLVCFLVFCGWWMWRCLCQEKRRIDAFVEKENRQMQLYERLLEKLDDCEVC